MVEDIRAWGKERLSDYLGTHAQSLRLARLTFGVVSFGLSLWLLWAMISWPQTPDDWIHLHRISALANALQQGKWFPRWLPEFSFGYGYPVFHFYAPAFYYPPAILTALGLNPLNATQVTLFCIYALSGYGMGIALFNGKSLFPALLGMIVFLVFPYRLYDLFVRGALPEFAAFLWLPFLIILYKRLYYHISHSDLTFPKQFVSLQWVLLSLLWAGLILTHNLTALMTAISALLVAPFVLWLQPSFRRGWQIVWWWLFPIFVGGLLSAWYWIPAILEASWVGIGAVSDAHGYRNHLVSWQNLFAVQPIYRYPGAAEPTVALPSWLAVVMGLAALFVIVRWRASRVARSLFAWLCLLAVTLWLTSTSSEFLWRILSPVLGKLQFPWRWQVIVAVLASLLVADLGTIIKEAVSNRRIEGIAAVLVALLAACFILASTVGVGAIPRLAQPPDISLAAMWAADAANGQVGASWTGEFLPKWVTEQRWAIGRAPSDNSSATDQSSLALAATVEQMRYEETSYRVTAQQPFTLTLHQFYYPAWQVRIDDQPTVTFPNGNLGLLAFTVPAGTHRIAVRFGATTAIWLGRIATALGWGFLLIVLWMRKERRLRAVGSWLGVGILFVLVSASTGVTLLTPAQPNLNFAALFLAGVDVQSAKVGETVPVRLHWLVKAPAPQLTAFVHIVADDGRLVAQSDAPVGGSYTPAERLLPGLLFNDWRSIPLPQDLTPGSYRLLIGLYPAGQPDAPLLAEGASEPRSFVSTLEVLP